MIAPQNDHSKASRHSVSKSIPSPRFLDVIENGYASEDNPLRVGYFVKATTTPRGRMNPGRHWQLTDGKGKFWELTPSVETRIIGNLLSQVAVTTAAYERPDTTPEAEKNAINRGRGL